MASAWDPPREFDDYTVLHRLGGGSMGSVYLAEDKVLARKVAIKFVATADPDSSARRRFLEEARAAARLQHANVVAVYRVGELAGRPYLVSEFVRGRTLDQVDRPMPWERALEIGIQLARGLAAAHRNRVLHCDVKPSNAILAEDGTAKLFDFGLAKLLRTGDDGGDSPGGQAGITGTPAYIAPEIWRGEAPSRRSDVYGLGALLFELVTGRPPFDDVPLSDLPRVVQEREPRPLRKRSGPVEARFSAAVGRCLRRDPLERFPSGEELRDALEQAARSASSGSMPGGNPYRGLRAFEADHRAIFFGRSSEVGLVVERLRSDGFVLVAGDSGVGKSSLCRAGVLPSVADGALGEGRRWIAATAIPGRRPLSATCAALAPVLDTTEDDLARSLRAEPSALPRLVRAALGTSCGIVLFVDQLEELLTIADEDETRIVTSALGAIAAGVPGVRLLATLRGDFITRFAALEHVGEDLSRVLFVLRPLTPERIRDAIVGPAQLTGTRFESEEMVDELVATTSAAEGSLPLLQFALAELWEARERTTNCIPRAALDAVGGVEGALARHADAVITALSPAQRVAARRLLSRLVTLDGTRARKTDEELGTGDPAAREALAALVRGRLVVAQDAEQGSAYEVAHEVLVRGWGRLKRWLEEDAQLRVAREGLARAAAEWERLGRSRDALLGAQQLDEVESLDAPDLTRIERALIAASRVMLARRRWVRAGVAAAIPLVALAAYGGTRFSARHELSLRVEQHLAAGARALAAARIASDDATQLRSQAFARFDEHDRDTGQRLWTQALARVAAAERALGDGSREIEAALAQDPSRRDIRDLLAGALYERALLAEDAFRIAERQELVERFVLYDVTGERSRLWNALAHLSVRTDPPGAEATLEAPGQPLRSLGPTPIADVAVAPGSYVLVLSAAGRAPVCDPFLVSRAEKLAIDVELPLHSSVPPGFAYVPPGRFLFGSSADEETRRGFLDTVPLHSVSTGPYLVGRTEVTWGDWLAFLRALPAPQRARRTPYIAGSASTTMAVRLDRTADGRFRLTLQTTHERLAAVEGEPLVYPRRTSDARMDWRRLPVVGISAEDAEAYAAFLRRSGRVRGARLCTEYEWERAARGADGRKYPAGNDLSPEQANYDETHGKESLGPDEVGSHPASRSPFGLDDASGNAFEWTRSSLAPGEYVLRGGSYFHDRKTAQLPNRNVSTGTARDATLGMRVCADLG